MKIFNIFCVLILIYSLLTHFDIFFASLFIFFCLLSPNTATWQEGRDVCLSLADDSDLARSMFKIAKTFSQI